MLARKINATDKDIIMNAKILKVLEDCQNKKIIN
jgi:hypothetical protein